MAKDVVKDSETQEAPRPKVTDAFMKDIEQSTKAALDAQPKRTIRLVKAGKNESNYETVQINGYTFQIRRGDEVQVPQTVYDILAEAGKI